MIDLIIVLILGWSLLTAGTIVLEFAGRRRVRRWVSSQIRGARRWLREHGLAPFGFAQEDFRHHHQLLRVWGPLCPARWEVRRWPVGTGNSDMHDWIKPLPWGSREAYHRIDLSADAIYLGRDWRRARIAMRGRPE